MIDDSIEIFVRARAKDSISKRVMASLIDYFLFFFIYLISIITLGEKIDENTYELKGYKSFIPWAYWFLNFIIFEYYYNWSIGKLLFKLKVVSLDNEKPKFTQILKRRLCDLIDLVWCFGLLGYILARNTIYSQRLGDIWAKTTVIKV